MGLLGDYRHCGHDHVYSRLYLGVLLMGNLPDVYDQYSHKETEEPVVEVTEEPGYCTACNGSGEGMYDGSVCNTCKGKGEI